MCVYTHVHTLHVDLPCVCVCVCMCVCVCVCVCVARVSACTCVDLTFLKPSDLIERGVRHVMDVVSEERDYSTQ